MPNTSRHLGIIFSLLTLLLVASAEAQQPDVRLSPPEPLSYRIEQEALFQDADGYGDRVLVAWGSTHTIPGGNVISQIRVQLLIDGVATGEQRALTSDNARPYGVVIVVAMQQGFAIVWNDRRNNDTAVYMQRVFSDGIPSGREQRVGSGIISPYEFWLLGDPTRERLLLWNDMQMPNQDLHTLRFTVTGELRTTKQRIGKTATGISSYHTLPGFWMVRRLDGVRYVVDPSGVINVRIVPAGHLDVPHHLGSDMSLLHLQNDTLQFFTSLFEIQPARILHLPALDSAYANTTLVTRDSAGAIHVYFTVFSKVRVQADLAEYLRANSYDLEITTDGRILPPRLLFSQERANYDLIPNGNGTRHRLYSVHNLQRCGNTGRVGFQWVSAFFSRGGQVGEATTEWVFHSMDTAGRYTDDSLGFIAKCAPIRPITVQRIDTSHGSVVRVTINGKQITLRTEASSVTADITQLTPALFVRNDRLICTWHQKWNLRWYNPDGVDTSFAFELRGASPDSPLRSIGHLSPRDTLRPSFQPSGYNDRTLSSGYSQTLSPSTPPGTSTVNVLEKVWVRFHRAFSPTYTTEMTQYWVRNTLYRPELDGWAPVMSIYNPPEPASTPPQPAHIWQEAVVAGYDPNRDEVLLKVYTVREFQRSSLGFEVRGYSGDGTMWSIQKAPFVDSTASLVPAGEGRYIECRGRVGILFNGTDTLQWFTMSQPGPGLVYQRLLGEYFLRRYWVDSTGRDMRLEIFTLNGTLVHRRTLTLGVYTSQVTVAQNPNDGSLAIVTAGTNGLRVTHLTDALDPIVTDTLISPTTHAITPAAAFRNDSLFVVWDDGRNGGHDIYSNSVALRRQTSGIVDESIGLSSVSLTPNPARHTATVSLHLARAGVVSIDVVDLLGSVVQSEDLGHRSLGKVQYDLALGDLIPGHYIVRCRTAEGIVARPLMITR